MIKLKNIKIEHNVVKSEIILEDCKEIGKIEIDLTGRKILNSVVPTGYEWCKKHLEHARDYLIEIAESKTKIPSEKLIMWC